MLSGTAAAGAIAGCMGGGGDTETTTGDQNSTAGQNPGTTATEKGVPDLSGHNVHFITVAAATPVQDLWKKVVSNFEKETGAKVNLEFVQTSDVSRITQLLQAGNPPEVVQLGLTNTYLLQNRGVLQPLDDVYDRATQRLGTPTDTVQKVVKHDGHTWIIPAFHNVNMYSYRSDVADIVPDTWDKALEYARVVDQKDTDIRGTYVPISGGVPGAVRLVSWLWTNKGSIAERDDNGNVKINFDEEPYRGRMIELLNFLQKRQQYSPPGEGAGWADIMNIIQTGRAASSWYGGVRQKNAAIRNDRPFAKDIKLVPGMPINKEDTVDGSTEGWVTFKGADTKAAKAFIDYLLQKDFLANFLTQLSPIHNIPSWPQVKNSDKYLSGIKSTDLWSGWSMEQFNNYQKKALSKMVSKTMDTEPPNPYAVTYYSDPIYNLQGEVLRNKTDPASVIDKYAKQLQQSVNEAQKD